MPEDLGYPVKKIVKIRIPSSSTTMMTGFFTGMGWIENLIKLINEAYPDHVGPVLRPGPDR